MKESYTYFDSLDCVLRNGIINGVDDETFKTYFVKVSRPMFKTLSTTYGEYHGKMGTLTIVQISDGDDIIGTKKFFKRDDGKWLTAFKAADTAKRIYYEPGKAASSGSQ